MTQLAATGKVLTMTDRERLCELLQSFGIETSVQAPQPGSYEEGLGVAEMLIFEIGEKTGLWLGSDYVPTFGFDGAGKFVGCGSIV